MSGPINVRNSSVAIGTPINTPLTYYTRKQNLSIKMLKDVGMTVPKSREMNSTNVKNSRRVKMSYSRCCRIGGPPFSWTPQSTLPRIGGPPVHLS